MTPPDDPAVRQRQRDLVRQGYDRISNTYRTDDGRPARATDASTERYAAWLDELAGHLPEGARVLDLGCGAGVPASRWLVDAGFEVTGVDISEVQIERARRLVPGARFVCEDMASFDVADGTFGAVVTLYALIHVPLEDQRQLLPRIARWLSAGGLLLAIVGHERWTGVEDYMGAPMFWDHADAATYVTWMQEAGLRVLWRRFVPEGASGHVLVLARRL